MNVKIQDIMTAQVMTATPHQTFAHVKSVLNRNQGSCLPVVGPNREPVGIITASDLLGQHPDNQPISKFMSTKIFTVPSTSDVSLAARIMRKHHIHHVIVTEKNEVVGLVSAYDLLQLVEDHRFVVKNPPDVSSKKKGGRRRQELMSEGTEE